MRTVPGNDSAADSRFKPSHPSVDGLMPSVEKLINSTCVFLALAENPFTTYLNQRHFIEAGWIPESFFPFDGVPRLNFPQASVGKFPQNIPAPVRNAPQNVVFPVVWNVRPFPDSSSRC